MYCNNCGNKLSEDVKFCPHCGSPVNGKARVSGKGLLPQTLSDKQKTWLIVCGIWLVVWLILKALIFPDRKYDHEERTIFNVIAFGVPILASLILLLIQRTKKSKEEMDTVLEEIPFVDFVKGYDGVRIDKIANKYTGTSTRYCVFSKEMRAEFDETVDQAMGAEQISQIKKELYVIKKGDKLVITRKL